MGFDAASTIDQFEAGGEKLALSIRGLKREDMLCIPPADANVGLWSIQQVVIHCQDSELVGIDRMHRMIAEENPSLIGYNENLFAQNLFYNEQSADDAVQLVDLSRKQFARVLRKLSPSAWDRAGQHNETGEVKLGKQLQKYVEHLDHHISFIHKKRAWMGKEMW